MNAVVAASLSSRLKEETREAHDRLDSRISGLSAFSTRAHYARFLRVQLRFQCATAPLYEDTRQQKQFAGLLERCRLDRIEADCRDMGVAQELLDRDQVIGQAITVADPYTAVGWLYTNEGSNLGAAFLFKRAEKMLGLSAAFGARHLAAHPEGRGLYWKRFKAQLDMLSFDEEQQGLAIAGAHDAFSFVRESVEQIMARD